MILLSIDEKKQYFASDLDSVTEDLEGEKSLWWLRSLGSYGVTAAAVDFYGTITRSGYNVDDVSVGVRPALWVDISNL